MTRNAINGSSTSSVANPGLPRPPQIFLTAIILGVVVHLFLDLHSS